MTSVIVDLSSNNANPASIDWATAKSHGLVAVIGKATQGTTYKNPEYAGYLACLSFGIPFAAYHYANFTNAVAEANYFRSVAGKYAKILDSETNKNAVWQQQFIDALGLASDQDMDYGSASTLPHGVRSLLWPAAYGPRAPGFGQQWQYTDKLVIPGIPGAVDASVWTGTQAQFNIFFGLAPAPPIFNKEKDMIASTPDDNGYWIVTPQDGAIYSYGNAQWLGALNYPTNALVAGDYVTGFTAHKTQPGYWISTYQGHVYAFGAAKYYKSPADPAK